MGTQRTLWAVFAILAVAALVAVAGVAQAGHHEDRGEPQVTDAEGDATEYNSDYVATQATAQCRAGGTTATQACRQAATPALSEAPTTDGLPADPSLDILSVTLWETSKTLKVTLEVAEIDEGWNGYENEGPFGVQRASWEVAWYNDEERGCREWVGTQGAHGGVYLNSEDHCGDPGPPPEESWERGCNYAFRCGVRTSLDVEPGSPGFITWTVPRDALVNGDEGWALHDVWAQVEVFPGDSIDRGCAICWGFSTQGHTEWGAVIGRQYTVDRTEPGAPFIFEDPRSMWEPDPEEPYARVDPNFRYDPTEHPEANILSYDLDETPETLRFVATFSHVAEDPADIQHFVEFMLSSGHIVDFWIFNDAGSYGIYASYFEPGTGLLLSNNYHFVVVPAELDVTPGEPGTLEVTIDRSHIPTIEAGGLSKLGYWLVWDDDDGTVWAGHEVDEADARAWAGSAWTREESIGGWADAPLYRFLHDTPSQVLDTFVRVSDATGDTQAPDPAFDESLQARFDVTYIEARAVDADETHLTIGVNDLSRATVPRGYDGMFYALAAQKGERTTMVGYHKAADASAGDFLCAPDITILTETQRDPTEAVWTLIDGVVSAPPGGGGGGAGGPGAITFHVPNACFGEEAVDPSGDSIGFDRFAAGTYLVRSGAGGVTQGTVYEVDSAEADGPVSLVIPGDAQLEPAGWYAAPFGVESFWDILGIGLAVALATSGAAVKLRRRRLDKAVISDAKAREDRDVYRAALERATAADVDPASDTVLRALRNRLGISEREHAMLELEAASAAGRGVAGLAEGALFLGKYRIERQLGEGGFARTYLARDEKLARDVVLKVARWGTPKEMRRALREARIIARAEHENIVRVFDVEEVADLGVLVLEYVPGGSLAEHLEGGPLPLDEALAVADGVLAGLEAAHGEGIVHRDVKPGNILLTRDGRAKLVDFGIARAPEGSGTVTGGTLNGKGAGTVRYMAPEQARGDGTDQRSDVYSAGAVLYEMLTGASCIPLDGLPEFEARKAVVEVPPQLPIERVPRGVNQVLERVLAKDPAERPQGASEMRRLLEGATGEA